MALIYRVIRDNLELSEAQIGMGSTELKKLHKARGSLRIRTDGLMEIRMACHNRVRWCTVCPPTSGQTVIWQTHTLELGRTLSRIQLTWYWPGVTAEVRRVICSCEVCQTANSGGNEDLDIVNACTREDHRVASIW